MQSVPRTKGAAMRVSVFLISLLLPCLPNGPVLAWGPILGSKYFQATEAAPPAPEPKADTRAPEIERESELDDEFDNKFEQLRKKLVDELKRQGKSVDDVVKLMIQAKEQEEQAIKAKIREELAVTLSNDALFIGPLATFDMTYDAKKKPLIKRFTVLEVREKAQEIVKGLQGSLEETKKRVSDMKKKTGAEYGVCSIGHLQSFRVTLIKLSTWAEAIGRNAKMEQAIRQFNTNFHRLHADFKEWEKLVPLHCMIAMFQAQQNAM